MLRSVGYLACLAGIGPVVGLALFFWLVDRVASSGGWPGFGRLLLRLLELVGTPWKMLAVILVTLGLVVAGCVPATRGWACLVVGVLGLVCLGQILAIARPTEPGQFVILVPSAVATAVAFVWSWQILKVDFLGGS
jgi:hypothetical protein